MSAIFPALWTRSPHTLVAQLLYWRKRMQLLDAPSPVSPTHTGCGSVAVGMVDSNHRGNQERAGFPQGMRCCVQALPQEMQSLPQVTLKVFSGRTGDLVTPATCQKTHGTHTRTPGGSQVGRAQHPGQHRPSHTGTSQEGPGPQSTGHYRSPEPKGDHTPTSKSRSPRRDRDAGKQQSSEKMDRKSESLKDKKLNSTPAMGCT